MLFLRYIKSLYLNVTSNITILKSMVINILLIKGKNMLKEDIEPTMDPINTLLFFTPLLKTIFTKDNIRKSYTKLIKKIISTYITIIYSP